MKKCKAVSRAASIVTGKANLEPLYSLHNFPVFMGCTDQKNDGNDLFADMEWGICPESGIIQLLKLIPPKILYQNQHNEGLGQIWTDHYVKFVKFLNKFSPRNVLEIGGAHGIIGSMFLDANPNSSWSIIDPNPTVKDTRLKVIKGWFNEKFVFPDKEVDTVVHSHLLEHLYNPPELLSHIYSFLKPGQMHIFTFPNLYEFLKKKYTNCLNFEHTLFLTEELVDYLLLKTGFKIVEKSYFRDHSIFYCTQRSIPNTTVKPPNKYKEYKELFLDFTKYHEEMVNDLNNRIKKEPGQIYLFGAHIFSQYLIAFGLKTDKIIAILDNSQMKQGKRLYGTNLFVKSPQVLKNKPNVKVILKAANYNEEIKKDILGNINSQVSFW